MPINDDQLRLSRVGSNAANYAALHDQQQFGHEAAAMYAAASRSVDLAMLQHFAPMLSPTPEAPVNRFDLMMAAFDA